MNPSIENRDCRHELAPAGALASEGIGASAAVLALHAVLHRLLARLTNRSRG